MMAGFEGSNACIGRHAFVIYSSPVYRDRYRREEDRVRLAITVTVLSARASSLPGYS
jgi:hypothetical protein